MPTNLYGPGDNYHSENSHVIPALIRRFHEAKSSNSNSVVIWGSGKPCREFLYVDDMAEACVHVMTLSKETHDQQIKPMQSHINVGYGEDVTIKKLAETIKHVVGFNGEIQFDESKPDGTPRKLMDSSLLKSFGWSAEVGLKEGLERSYIDFIQYNNMLRMDIKEDK